MIIQNLLDDEANKRSKQKPGFKSALVDIRPTTDGRVCHWNTIVVAVDHNSVPEYW
jgi:hypothetical protein